LTQQRQPAESRAPYGLVVTVATVALLAVTVVAHAALPSPRHTVDKPEPIVLRAPIVEAPAPDAPPPMLIYGAPVASFPIISPFGLRKLPWEERGRLHQGVDIQAPPGFPVRVVADGVVTRAGQDGGYGRFVEVRHAEGLSTVYAHLGSVGVAPGTALKRGATLGKIGSSGSSTGPHLHFEVRNAADRPLNPEYFIGRVYATAADLPLTEAARFPRHVRIAYVSRIPRSRLEQMAAREEAAEEAKLAAETARLAHAEAARLSKVRTIAPAELEALEQSAADLKDMASDATSAGVDASGRVSATLEPFPVTEIGRERTGGVVD
jgi:hypothetical protein